MNTDVTIPPEAGRWSANQPHVRKAIAYIKRRGRVTAEELVTWDARNGRRLFNWDDEDAATEWRKHQARQFLNSFRAKFEGMRVRAFIHVRENQEAGIEESAYFSIESIAKHPGMREQVIADVSKRMETLGSELTMWDLTPGEQDSLFDRLRAVISGRTVDEVAPAVAPIRQNHRHLPQEATT